MTKTTYLKLCLLLPIVAPAILILTDSEVGGFLLWSLLVGGPIYLPFCITLLIWSRNKTETEIINIAWKAPFIFTAIIDLAYLSTALYQAIIHDTYKIESTISGIVFFSLASLFLGYIYVGVSMLTMRIIFSKAKSSSSHV